MIISLLDIKDHKIIVSRDVKFDEKPFYAQVKENQNKVILHIEEEQNKLQDKSIKELEEDKKQEERDIPDEKRNRKLP